MRRVLYASVIGLVILGAGLLAPAAQAASCTQARPLDLTIDIAGISMSVVGSVSGDGSCSGTFTLKLDPDGILVPDLPVLRKVGLRQLSWRF